MRRAPTVHSKKMKPENAILACRASLSFELCASGEFVEQFSQFGPSSDATEVHDCRCAGSEEFRRFSMVAWYIQPANFTSVPKDKLASVYEC